MAVSRYLSLSAITFRLRLVRPLARAIFYAPAQLVFLPFFDSMQRRTTARSLPVSKALMDVGLSRPHKKLYGKEGEVHNVSWRPRRSAVERAVQREALLNTISHPNVVSDAAVLVDHAMWITRLREHLYGSLRLEPRTVARSDSCALARWLREEQPNMGHLPDYWRCLALHARWHNCAARVVDLASHGRRLEAELALAPGGQLRCLSAELVSTFARLRQDCINRDARAIPAHDFGVCALEKH